MKRTKQSSFGDVPLNNTIIKIDYENRLKNITYEEAEKRVFDKLGFIETKPGVGMMWTKKTKSVNFLDKKGKIFAIYNQTIKDFWEV